MTVKRSFDAFALKMPDDSLGFVLWRTTHAWQRHLERALEPTGLTHLRSALLIALAWLTREGAQVTQRELADFLDMRPMQVSQVVTAMEAAGLVRRTASPQDRRALHVDLTPSGDAAFRDAMPIVEDAHKRFFGAAGARADRMRRDLLALPR